MFKIIKLSILRVSELKMFLKIFKKFIRNKNIKTNIFRIQASNSIMWGYFCIRFIDFVLAGKNLIKYTSFFKTYDLEKYNNIILSYFKNERSN